MLNILIGHGSDALLRDLTHSKRKTISFSNYTGIMHWTHYAVRSLQLTLFIHNIAIYIPCPGEFPVKEKQGIS